MESLFSESYYLQKWDIYMEIYEEADLEKKLKKRLKVIDSMPISEADKVRHTRFWKTWRRERLLPSARKKR